MKVQGQGQGLCQSLECRRMIRIQHHREAFENDHRRDGTWRFCPASAGNGQKENDDLGLMTDGRFSDDRFCENWRTTLDENRTCWAMEA